MNYSYKPKGVCPVNIEFDIEDGIIHNVKYTGGCNGNLQAVSRLVEGLPAEDVVSKLEGISCGFKGTSCGDQLAKAINEVLGK